MTNNFKKELKKIKQHILAYVLRPGYNYDGKSKHETIVITDKDVDTGNSLTDYQLINHIVLDIHSVSLFQ